MLHSEAENMGYLFLSLSLSDPMYAANVSPH